MTESDKLQMTKVMVDEDVEESTLVTYLRMAGISILNRAYPYGYEDDAVVPARYGALQCEIAAYLYNKRGAEGQTTHDENGVKRVYETGSVPDSMLSMITPFVGVLKHAQHEEE